MDAEFELVRVGPECDLGEDLVREGAGHDEGGVAGSAPKVDETALSKEDDVVAVGHEEAINLGLDVDALNGVLLEPGNINLDVEVTNARCIMRRYDATFA